MTNLEGKCGWHVLYHKKNSTAGEAMRGYIESDGKNAPAYNCSKCDGYNTSCANHQDYDPKAKGETKK